MKKEFKAFIMRGNVIDLAVGVVIGGAFTAIVNSLVNDIIMPIIGVLIAGIDFSDLKIVLSQAVVENGEIVTPEAAINYGILIQTVIVFLIVALVIFFMVKGLNKLKKEETEEPKPEEPPADVLLLTEIRDLLKKDQA